MTLNSLVSCRSSPGTFPDSEKSARLESAGAINLYSLRTEGVNGQMLADVLKNFPAGKSHHFCGQFDVADATLTHHVIN
jgi:hypothetical protein